MYIYRNLRRNIQINMISFSCWRPVTLFRWILMDWATLMWRWEETTGLILMVFKRSSWSQKETLEDVRRKRPKPSSGHWIQSGMRRSKCEQHFLIADWGSKLLFFSALRTGDRDRRLSIEVNRVNIILRL